jgi:hypothetical protein
VLEPGNSKKSKVQDFVQATSVAIKTLAHVIAVLKLLLNSNKFINKKRFNKRSFIDGWTKRIKKNHHRIIINDEFYMSFQELQITVSVKHQRLVVA